MINDACYPHTFHRYELNLIFPFFHRILYIFVSVWTESRLASSFSVGAESISVFFSIISEEDSRRKNQFEMIQNAETFFNRAQAKNN